MPSAGRRFTKLCKTTSFRIPNLLLGKSSTTLAAKLTRPWGYIRRFAVGPVFFVLGINAGDAGGFAVALAVAVAAATFVLNEEMTPLQLQFCVCDNSS